MMDRDKNFRRIISIIGEPARAAMLWNLLDGRAYTAGELALCADISAQSASNHLTKLIQAELLAVEVQGRHRYYRLAKPEVAYAIESIANLIPSKEKLLYKEKIPESGVRYARTCYDHLAGKAGVMITESLVAKGILLPKSKTYDVTPAGVVWFGKLGIDINGLAVSKRSFARLCLDWSERKHHLAGAVGASFLQRMIELDWIRKKKNTREVLVTFKGRERLYSLLKLNIQ